MAVICSFVGSLLHTFHFHSQFFQLKKRRYFCIFIPFITCHSVLIHSIIFCLFLILVNFIYQPLSEIELIEGHTSILKYKLSSSRFPVRFLKDNQFIAETTNIRKRVIGRSKTLKFTYVAPSDSGKYCLEVAGKQSSLTELKIHRMLYYFSFWLRNTRSPLCCNLLLHIIFGGLFIVFRYFVSIVLHFLTLQKLLWI